MTAEHGHEARGGDAKSRADSHQRPPARVAGPILIGTSGYSFPDWVGPFYPRGTKPAEFLGYYAQHFDAVEVNSTYYGIPQPRVLDQMGKKTPPHFRFVVKINQAMTHERSRDPALYKQFLDAIEPLKVAGKFDGLLAQFPWAFQRDPGAIQHLGAIRKLLPDDPLFVEFRHKSWIVPSLMGELTALNVGYCSVDEPRLSGLVPPIPIRTGDDAYVRFHGRNAGTWWNSSRGDRYDYEYKDTELKEWLGRIRELAEQARRTYLFFNNCHAGQAARSAKLMQELLRQQKLA